ncbi:DUF6919 domain-containing protein [Streptomyces scopuliridis]|uniref:DUF6919 domain-containing protein n=1 Tax=Streptomyces scopuliridis TaxID=452529 RepID=UPI0036784DBD
MAWMSRRDRRAWQSATTLADLGELTARWLEGDLGSRPGYTPRHGPDEETADLIQTLAACNRSGFLTDQSQPGISAGRDGWRQRAAVQGWIADGRLLADVTAAAHKAGLLVIVHEPGAIDDDSYIIATERHGVPHTAFGTPFRREDLHATWGSTAAYLNVLTANTVTVVDPKWGRNDRLWPALDRLTRRATV